MLTDIRLQNFRSYKDASFELGPGVNIIVGPNASGKTNLLEAILYISVGKSYRAPDKELAKTSKNWARIDAHTGDGTRTLKLKLVPKEEKTFEINNKLFKKIGPAQLVPAVLFEPDHLRILSGEPQLRRQYLDVWLKQLMPEFEKTEQQFTRALRQRNALLKQRGGRSQLFAWNLRFSELGGQVAAHRKSLIDLINKDLAKSYSSIAGKRTALEAEYKTSVTGADYTSALLKKLEESEELDYLRGFTGHGPHRDDLIFKINGHPMEQVASRGEARTLVLALKTKELKTLQQKLGLRPLLLLDDVFSELDGRRRKAVTELVRDYQTFITTTDADVVIKQFSEKCSVIAL